jgi:hypothetical protein
MPIFDCSESCSAVNGSEGDLLAALRCSGMISDVEAARFIHRVRFDLPAEAGDDYTFSLPVVAWIPRMTVSSWVPVRRSW